MGVFVDIHVLQSVPPSNINRDDSGSPKTATYGGTRRARVSSQAWKKATRVRMKDSFDASELGFRTKRALGELVVRLETLLPDATPEERRTRAEGVLGKLGLKLVEGRKKPKKGQDAASTEGDEPDADKTQYLVFFSARQLGRLATLAAGEEAVTEKAAKAAADQDHGIDVGVFGRMVADASDINVDAAVQCAHALSTHEVVPEFDYYTAMDDLAPDDNPGADMIGVVEFNSATYYRYATVNIGGLLENLGDKDAAVKAAAAFVDAFVTSMPTGKRNTFANGTPVDLAVVALRTDQPLSWVGAFERAVPASSEGYVERSTRQLVEYVRDVEAAYARPAEVALVARVGERTKEAEGLGEVMPLPELGARLSDELRRRLADD